MVGGDRAWRREEAETLRRHHRAGARFDDGLQLVEQSHQELAIIRFALDILEHRPTAIGVDSADRLADRQAVCGYVLWPDADGQVARIIFDLRGGKPLAQAGRRRERQQGMKIGRASCRDRVWKYV